MKKANPTDEEIRNAPMVLLVDDHCHCWSMVLAPSGVAPEPSDFDSGLCIPVDSSKLAVIEAWQERVQRLQQRV